MVGFLIFIFIFLDRRSRRKKLFRLKTVISYGHGLPSPRATGFCLRAPKHKALSEWFFFVSLFLHFWTGCLKMNNRRPYPEGRKRKKRKQNKRIGQLYFLTLFTQHFFLYHLCATDMKS